MKKYITKEMFPELVVKCWENGITVEFEPSRSKVWFKTDGNYESIDVYDEVATVDSVMELLSKK